MVNSTLSKPKFKTCKRINAPGDIHFLTFSCFHKLPLLKSERAKRWLADSIMNACQKHQFDLHAYVFMPNHVHLLVRPENVEYDISKFLRSVKRPVTEIALKYLAESRAPESAFELIADPKPDGSLSFRFWQRGGGFDRNIQGSEEFFEKLGYMHNNPVKAGLCAVAEDWKYCSAGDYLRIRTGPIPITLLEE